MCLSQRIRKYFRTRLAKTKSPTLRRRAVVTVLELRLPLIKDGPQGTRDHFLHHLRPPPRLNYRVRFARNFRVSNRGDGATWRERDVALVYSEIYSHFAREPRKNTTLLRAEVCTQYVHSRGASRTTWKVLLNSQSDSREDGVRPPPPPPPWHDWSRGTLEIRKPVHGFLSRRERDEARAFCEVERDEQAALLIVAYRK